MKLLKSIFVIVLALALCFSFVSCSKDVETPRGMKLIESEFVSYKMYVPEEWAIVSESGFVSALCTDDKSSVSMLTMTGTKAYSNIEEYIDEYKSELAATYVGFEYIESESTMTGISLDGKDAARIVYKIRMGDTEYKYMQVITAVGYYVYTLTYTALSENFDAHLEEVYKIIEHFSFG